MHGMRGGVLSPQDARRLMSVLQEMSEYVDGEDLESIAAQKPIYEMGDGEPSPPQPDMETEPSDMGEGEEEEPKVDVDALILEGPHGGMGRPGRKR